MRELVENPRHVAKRVRPWTRRQRAVFAAACAERLFQTYARFDSDRAPELRDLLDRVWSALNENSAVTAELESIAERLRPLEPFIDDSKSQWSSAALNAVGATEAAVECLLKDGCDACAEAATMATDTIDLASPHQPRRGTTDAPSLLDKELAWQDGDLNDIERGMAVEAVRIRSAQRSLELAAGLERTMFDG